MSYFHMFFAVDLEELRRIYGSNDESFVQRVLEDCAYDLKDNDEFFEDYDDAPLPSSEELLREIVAGEIQTHDQSGIEAKYGYVLKVICEHIGTPVGDEVACVSDHPYDSVLTKSGPPLPIPVDEGDFPEMGYVALEDLPAEIERTKVTVNEDGDVERSAESVKLPPSFIARLLKFLGFHEAARSSHGGARFSDDDLQEDIDAYRRTLEEALQMGRSLISFRH